MIAVIFGFLIVARGLRFWKEISLDQRSLGFKNACDVSVGSILKFDSLSIS